MESGRADRSEQMTSTKDVYEISVRGTDIVYVGVSNAVPRRWKQHARKIDDARSGKKTPRMYATLCAYSEDDVEFCLISVGMPTSAAYAEETRLIREYRAAGMRVLNTHDVVPLMPTGFAFKTKAGYWTLVTRLGLSRGMTVLARADGVAGRGEVTLTELDDSQPRAGRINRWRYAKTATRYARGERLPLTEPWSEYKEQS